MSEDAATAPGKVMLAGEYAVLDGGTAVLVAVDRRARAHFAARGGGGPFLGAARDAVAAELGAAAADAFDHIAVDTDALSDGGRKLGLGSSAATTVAAIGLACGLAGVTDREVVHRLARRAHAAAQGRRGAPGSGADVAACVYGGTIAFTRAHGPADGAADANDSNHGDVILRALHLPPDLALHFAWTGTPADTATLVSAVAAARSHPAVQSALARIAAAADALAAADDASAAITAIADGSRATAALGDASGVALVPPVMAALSRALDPLGAAAKTTGAGGGDIIVIAARSSVDRTEIDRAVIASGLLPIALSIDPRGITLQPHRSS